MQSSILERAFFNFPVQGHSWNGVHTSHGASHTRKDPELRQKYTATQIPYIPPNRGSSLLRASGDRRAAADLMPVPQPDEPTEEERKSSAQKLSRMRALQGNTPPQEGRVVRPAWSQRAIRRAPLESHDLLKEKRRNMFLNKVKNSREDGRFEKMGNDIMRLEFVREQRQWEAEQAQSAPELASEAEEDSYEHLGAWDNEDDFAHSSAELPTLYTEHYVPRSSPEEEAEVVASREKEELDALLSLLPGQGMAVASTDVQANQDRMSEHFGSDDEEFEALFQDIAIDDVKFDCVQTQRQFMSGPGDEATSINVTDAMDMS